MRPGSIRLLNELLTRQGTPGKGLSEDVYNINPTRYFNGKDRVIFLIRKLFPSFFRFFLQTHNQVSWHSSGR